MVSNDHSLSYLYLCLNFYHLLNILIKSLYTMETKHDKKTQSQLNNIHTFLEEKYGNVSSEWETIIELLGDNLDLYNQCKSSIKENGIYNKESGRKNPLLSTMKDLQAQALKCISHLGLSPYAASKIKTGEDDTADFVDGLVN